MMTAPTNILRTPVILRIIGAIGLIMPLCLYPSMGQLHDENRRLYANRRGKMIIRVMYTDYSYDYVNVRKLDQLIASKRIVKFARPSEDVWVDITRDPIRSTGKAAYTGPERRFSHRIPLQS